MKLHVIGPLLLALLILSSCEYEDIYPVSKRTVPADYRPYVKEGKRWDYVHNGASYSYIIQGDTLISKTSYKKLFIKESGQRQYVGALRENAMQVILVRSGLRQEEILFDFGVHAGDKMKWHNLKLKFYSVDDWFTISMGNRFRTIAADAVTDGGIFKELAAFGINWIEGIGMKEDVLKYPGVKLLSCYEEGACIYNWEHEGSDDGTCKTEPFDPNVFDSPAEETAFHDWVEAYPDSAGYMNIWFEGSTLCVKGAMKLGPYPAFAECFTANYNEEGLKEVNEIRFSIYQMNDMSEKELVPSWVNLRIGGFQPGKYHFIPNNRGPFIVPMKEQTLTCNN